MDRDLDQLVRAAFEARKQAYAPYSAYAVGAAILGSDGTVRTGCNVENVSFGLSICAERAAAFAMVADGCRRIEAVAVVTRDGGTPCGACLQVLSEFIAEPGAVPVICRGDGPETPPFTFAELLPFGFKSGSLG